MSIDKRNTMSIPVSLDYILYSEMQDFLIIAKKISIFLEPGKDWKNIPVTPGTIVLEQPKADDPAGVIYNVSLTADIPATYESAFDHLDAVLLRDQVIIRVKMSDGSFRIIANPLYLIPTRVKIEFISSSSTDNVRLSVIMKLPTPCLILNL